MRANNAMMRRNYLTNHAHNASIFRLPRVSICQTRPKLVLNFRTWLMTRSFQPIDIVFASDYWINKVICHVSATLSLGCQIVINRLFLFISARLFCSFSFPPFLCKILARWRKVNANFSHFVLKIFKRIQFYLLSLSRLPSLLIKDERHRKFAI